MKIRCRGMGLLRRCEDAGQAVGVRLLFSRKVLAAVLAGANLALAPRWLQILPPGGLW